MKSNEAQKNALDAEQRGKGEKDERRVEGALTFRKSRCWKYLLTNNEDFLAQMEQIKIDMRPKISNLFKYNLLEEQRRKNLIDLAKCSYNTMKTLMKEHIILNYILYDNNLSCDYIASIYDDVIEESVLTTKLSFFGDEEKRA